MMLAQENTSLKRQIEMNPPNFGAGPSAAPQNATEMAETSKRLKKRELECQALWDTLKDMKRTGQNSFEMD
jgi:hypothetical protein